VADPVVPLIHMLEGVQKIQPVLVVLEDGLLLVATGSDMVECAGIFDPEGTSHEETLAYTGYDGMTVDLTLLPSFCLYDSAPLFLLLKWALSLFRSIHAPVREP